MLRSDYSVIPEWLRDYDDSVVPFPGYNIYRLNQNTLIYLFSDICMWIGQYRVMVRYFESVAFPFQFREILSIPFIKQHVRQVMFVAGDSKCRNRVGFGFHYYK